MNNKININPSSTKWLEKDDRVVADYFCDLGFRSLKQILDMRVFDLMNMQGLNAVRVEEVIICLYKWLNPNTAIDEAIYNGMMSQPFLYTPWRKEHKDLAAIKVGDLVLTPGINMKAIQHFYDAIRKAFFKSEDYNWRWYKFRNRSEYPLDCRCGTETEKRKRQAGREVQGVRGKMRRSMKRTGQKCGGRGLKRGRDGGNFSCKREISVVH